MLLSLSELLDCLKKNTSLAWDSICVYTFTVELHKEPQHCQLASADWLWDIFPHVELYQILHWKTSIFSQVRKTILSALNTKINGLWKNQYSCESMHSVSIQIMARNGPKVFWIEAFKRRWFVLLHFSMAPSSCRLISECHFSHKTNCNDTIQLL